MVGGDTWCQPLSSTWACIGKHVHPSMYTHTHTHMHMHMYTYTHYSTLYSHKDYHIHRIVDYYNQASDLQKIKLKLAFRLGWDFSFMYLLQTNFSGERKQSCLYQVWPLHLQARMKTRPSLHTNGGRNEKDGHGFPPSLAFHVILYFPLEEGSAHWPVPTRDIFNC